MAACRCGLVVLVKDPNMPEILVEMGIRSCNPAATTSASIDPIAKIVVVAGMEYRTMHGRASRPQSL